MSGSGKALLFDIDGTLADTDALHLKAFNQVFAPHGHVFDRDRASKELMGFSNISISERFLPGQSPERQAAIMAEKEEAFRKLASGQIKPLAGLMKLLALADRAEIPMVAVTNAPRLNAEMMLSGLGIMPRFKAVIIGDELPHGIHRADILEDAEGEEGNDCQGGEYAEKPGAERHDCCCRFSAGLSVEATIIPTWFVALRLAPSPRVRKRRRR